MKGDPDDGAIRYWAKRGQGIIDRAIALPLDHVSTDRMAKAAEDFFADRYGLPHDNRETPEDYEFVLKTVAGRVSVDVKWTPRTYGRLLRRMDTGRRPATVYVLIVGPRPSVFQLAGWAWGRDLMAQIRDLGHGPTYALDQSALSRDVDALMARFGFPRVVP